MNIFLQLFVGLFLEMTHGTKKLAIVYIFGVISGSLATSVFDQTVYLAGASGGCYALIAAHVATLIINWNDDVIILHQRFRLESVQDVLIKLNASCRNKHFSLNLVIVRLIKIMNRADKNLAQFLEIKYLKNQNFQKKIYNNSWPPSPIFFIEFFFRKDWNNF